jgi:mRNA-degrading endonuclease toxin of MazEF toxin-antitoxin module
MTYIPERGDMVWLDFNPQAGREQAKGTGLFSDDE